MTGKNTPRTRAKTKNRSWKGADVVKRFPKLTLVLVMMMMGTAHAATSGGVELKGANSGVTVPTWDDYRVLEQHVDEL